jgi:hypothetical protein
MKESKSNIVIERSPSKTSERPNEYVNNELMVPLPALEDQSNSFDSRQDAILGPIAQPSLQIPV